MAHSSGVWGWNQKRTQDLLCYLKLAWGDHMSSRCRRLIIFMLELNLKWRLPPLLLSDSPRLASSGVQRNTVSHCGPLAGVTAKPKLVHSGAPGSTWKNPSDTHYPTCGEEKLLDSAAVDTCWGKQLVIKIQNNRSRETFWMIWHTPTDHKPPVSKSDLCWLQRVKRFIHFDEGGAAVYYQPPLSSFLKAHKKNACKNRGSGHTAFHSLSCYLICLSPVWSCLHSISADEKQLSVFIFCLHYSLCLSSAFLWEPSWLRSRLVRDVNIGN